MLPSDVAFYTQIIQFLDCIKLGEKFTGQAPNGYHIITHGKNGFGDDVQFVYDSFTKKISENELDLYDTQTGLTDYRVLMGVADEEIVSVATGDLRGTMTCFVVERKNSFCAARVDYFVELLGKNIVQIGCAPGVQRRANYETFCKEYGDVELVSKSQFGLICKYQWKGPIHVKFEVKLSGYNQPILNEVAICELCTNSDNKLARFLDYKGAYGFYEEGAYALHLSAGVHTLRDLRNGAVMKDVEMAKVAYSALDCVDALEAFGICHRDITEDAFRPQKSIFVLTELGWAVRLGSKRDPYYPHPELASTFIKEKETLPADDAENVIFMLLNMMTDRLPWADTKGIKSITKKKKKFFEECMDGTSLKNNKTAGILCKLRAMIVKTPRNVELAVELKAELINLSKPDDPTLPVEWPGSNDKPTTKSFL
uniref:Protein kinase domain-containing protein n=1 Tax=Bursaphelenchus xylophilus TaxID=6326 RepID=A0A1I7SBE5_BURXY